MLRVDRRLSLAEAEHLARRHRRQRSECRVRRTRSHHAQAFTPNDPRYNEQWHYFEAAGGINAPPAWDKSTGTGVVVAVIDTGYRPHADLAANILPGYDFISDTFVANDGNGRDSDAQDPGDWINPGECGPGDPAAFEARAGTARTWPAPSPRVTNNSNGVAGVAFNARVVPARVLGKCGGFTSDIADAIVWTSGGTVSGVPANANPAKVLNISLGGGGSLRHHHAERHQLGAFARRVGHRGGGQQQCQRGQLLAGQLLGRGDGRGGGPQRRQGVVLELRRDRGSGGARVAAAAPTACCRRSMPGQTGPGADSYALYNGTSMATPHVVGRGGADAVGRSRRSRPTR